MWCILTFKAVVVMGCYEKEGSNQAKLDYPKKLILGILQDHRQFLINTYTLISGLNLNLKLRDGVFHAWTIVCVVAIKRCVISMQPQWETSFIGLWIRATQESLRLLICKQCIFKWHSHINSQWHRHKGEWLFSQVSLVSGVVVLQAICAVFLILLQWAFLFWFFYPLWSKTDFGLCILKKKMKLLLARNS